MKGKRFGTEEKIRILREADTGKSIVELCREKNISEATFHRWKRQFGQMDLNEAKRLKALEREDSELKKMLADAMLAKRVLEYALEKNCEPGAQETDGAGRRRRRPVFWAERLPDPAPGAGHPVVPGRPAQRPSAAAGGQHACPLRGTSPLRLPPDRGPAAPGGLAPVGKRQVQRLRRMEGLRVPPTQRKLVRRGQSTGWPTKATHRNHVWTWDFIADATVRGGALRMLTVLDEYTRECHVLRADRALKSTDVIALVQQAIAQHGAPEFIRSDNGSEFIAKELQRWLAEEKIKTIYIDPASPWQNGFVESFHGRFRDECLNRE
jgi:transposase-like protein